MFVKSAVLVAIFGFIAISASPLADYYPEADDVYEVYLPEEVDEVHRERRSLQPGAPGSPQLPGKDGGWSVNPNLGRDESGNTRGQIEVSHQGKDHEFNAGWGKVIRGPNKAKPTWHVGGSFKW